MPRENTSLPVLLLDDGRLELTQQRQRMTRWGLLTAFKGHRSDLASVPFVLRGLVSNFSRRVNLPAIFHDLCCDDLNRRFREGRTLDPRDPDGPICGPRETDVMFREFLIDRGTPTLMAWIYWDGVRLGALANPARRPGWGRDLFMVLIVTLGTAWFTVPAGICALVFLCLYLISEAVVDSIARLLRGRHDRRGAQAGGADRGADRLGAPTPG